MTWKDLRMKAEKKCSLTPEWSKKDYEIYDWRLNDEKGVALLADTPITEDITVYARTNYKNFDWDGTVLKGYTGAEPRGKIIIPTDTTEIKETVFAFCNDVTELSLMGCSKLKKLYWISLPMPFFHSHIKKIDLIDCTALKTLALEKIIIENMDLSKFKNLTELHLNMDFIKSIDLSS